MIRYLHTCVIHWDIWLEFSGLVASPFMRAPHQFFCQLIIYPPPREKLSRFDQNSTLGAMVGDDCISLLRERGLTTDDLNICESLMSEFVCAIRQEHIGIANYVAEHVGLQVMSECVTKRLIDESARASASRNKVTTLVNDAVPIHYSDDGQQLSLLLIKRKVLTLAFRGGDGGVDDGGKSVAASESLGIMETVKHAHALNVLSILGREALARIGPTPNTLDYADKLSPTEALRFVLARCLGAWQQTDCPKRGHRLLLTGMAPLHAGTKPDVSPLIRSTLSADRAHHSPPSPPSPSPPPQLIGLPSLLIGYALSTDRLCPLY